LRILKLIFFFYATLYDNDILNPQIFQQPVRYSPEVSTENEKNPTVFTFRMN
jgi:hypothetical protein